MKKSFKIVIIIAFFCFTGISHPQEVFTLEKAIQAALSRNTNIVKSSNSIAVYQSDVKNAYGNLLPNLSIGAGFGWQRFTNSGGQTQLDSLGRQLSVGQTQIDSRSWSVSAGGSVTLFDGLSSIAQINKSSSDLKAAELTLEKLKQDAVLRTVNYYNQILSFQKLLGFQQEDLKYNEGLLDEIKHKFDLQIVPVSDVYSQEAQTANSRVAYLQAKNNFEKAKINLLTYLSMDLSGNYLFDSLAAVVKDSSLLKSDPENLYNIAFSSRQDYLSIKYQQQSVQDQLIIARSGFFPRLSANYGFSSEAGEFSDLLNRKTYSFGLSLNIPIFSNWNTENSIQSAQAQFENINEDLRFLELSIKGQVKTAYLDLQTSKQQVEASGIALTASKESWQIKKETYALGGATYLDLQQAYNNYLQAQYNKISNEFNYLNAYYALLNSIGRY
ncbi:MAG TPA: TolC family protein [Ignavibacteriaceae bacterium]|nr:TolC family protein [Ignavibacteriaceae bacterium]